MNNKIFFIGIFLIAILILGCTQTTQQTPVTPKTVTETPKEQVTPAKTETAVTTTTTITGTSGTLFLVTDTENSRVLEIKVSGEIVWQYGCNSINSNDYCDYGAGDKQLNKPHFATYDGNNILITDKDNNRVIEVDHNKNIVWSYGGTEGFGDNQLNKPNSAIVRSNGNVLIADGINNRLIEVNKDKSIVWKYGCSDLSIAGKCLYGDGPGFLRNPNYAIELSNGDLLVTDTENNRIIELNKSDDVVWEYKSGLNIPQSANPTDNGIIIAGYRNNNVLEVSKDKQVVWEMDGLKLPTFATLTKTGTILITDSYNNRIIEVDNDKNILNNINSTIETVKPMFQLFRPQSAITR
jgi:hypothetical protein